MTAPGTVSGTDYYLAHTWRGEGCNPVAAMRFREEFADHAARVIASEVRAQGRTPISHERIVRILVEEGLE